MNLLSMSFLSLDHILILDLASSCSILLHMLMLKSGIPFHVEDNKFEGFLFIVLLDFEDPLNDLLPLKIVLLAKIPKVLHCMSSSSSTPILISINFIRG